MSWPLSCRASSLVWSEDIVMQYCENSQIYKSLRYRYAYISQGKCLLLCNRSNIQYLGNWESSSNWSREDNNIRMSIDDFVLTSHLPCRNNSLLGVRTYFVEYEYNHWWQTINTQFWITERLWLSDEPSSNQSENCVQTTSFYHSAVFYWKYILMNLN